MSVRVMTAVWEHGPHDSSLRFVLLTLADESDHNGRNCFPGLERIAGKTQLGIRQVQRVLQKLAAQGWITIEREGRGRGVRTQFVVHVEKLAGKGDILTPFKAVENGASWTPEKVTFATVKGDICDNPPAPPIRCTQKHPNTNTNTPLPPSQASGGLRKEANEAAHAQNNHAGIELDRSAGAGSDPAVCPKPSARRIASQGGLQRAGSTADAGVGAVASVGRVMRVRRRRARDGPSDAAFVYRGPQMPDEVVCELRAKFLEREKQQRLGGVG